MNSSPWYKKYQELRSKVEKLRQRFEDRCGELGLDLNVVLAEFTREIVARAVYESNWQEGIEVDVGQTQVLASLAFDEMEDVAGPHLDMNKITRLHRDAVLRLKRQGASVEELAAYNLATAHQAIVWVGSELAGRQAASLAQVLRLIQKHYKALPQERITPEMRRTFEEAAALIDSLEADEQRISTPMTSMPRTAGQYVSELLKLEPESLVNPMRPSYIHFFHRLLLMGIIAPSKAGRFRRKPVHVGNANVFFATPSAIPSLMEEFCRDFPTILPTVVKYDQIMIAARMSHRFVSIHPYEDGNGRISRVLMNLVLWRHFPPVYLKADAKGRHRYSQVLRRADRGDFEGLGALICLSLIEIYEKMLGSLGSSAAEKSPF